jgi:hypothetical protein
MKERASALFGDASNCSCCCFRTSTPDATSTENKHGKRERDGGGEIVCARCQAEVTLLACERQRALTHLVLLAHRRHLRQFTHTTPSLITLTCTRSLSQHSPPPQRHLDLTERQPLFHRLRTSTFVCDWSASLLTPTPTPTQSSLLNPLGIHFLATSPHQYIIASK